MPKQYWKGNRPEQKTSLHIKVRTRRKLHRIRERLWDEQRERFKDLDDFMNSMCNWVWSELETQAKANSEPEQDEPVTDDE